jgi:hypothetical protein
MNQLVLIGLTLLSLIPNSSEIQFDPNYWVLRIGINRSIKMALNAANGLPFNRGSELNRTATMPSNPGALNS